MVLYSLSSKSIKFLLLVFFFLGVDSCWCSYGFHIHLSGYFLHWFAKPTATLLLYLGLGPAMLRRLEKVFQSTQAVLNLQLVQKSKDMATCGSIKNGSGLLLKCFQGLNTTLRLLYEIYILLFFPANRNALGSLHIQNHPLYNDHKIATSLVSAPLS